MSYREGESQLLLFDDLGPLEPAALRERLERRLQRPVDLVLTRNRTNVLSFSEREDGTIRVRLQRVFLEAPEHVLDAVASFIRRPRREARELLLDYFDSRPEADRRPPRPRRPVSELRSAGRFHDLGEILSGLNARFFGGALRSAITWGRSGLAPARRSRRRRGRAIRFGSYAREHDLIRIHPVLDSAWVPRLFVEAIVFHEMLHAVYPVDRGPGGRRRVHSPEFRRRERSFPGHAEALRWEKENLARLLASRSLQTHAKRASTPFHAPFLAADARSCCVW